MPKTQEKKTIINPSSRLIELLRKHGWNEAVKILKEEQAAAKA